MNEAAWKSRFDAALRVREGALTIRVAREGYETVFDAWKRMQFGKRQVPGYALPSKGTRRRWHREVNERRLLRKGVKAPVLPRAFFAAEEN